MVRSSSHKSLLFTDEVNLSSTATPLAISPSFISSDTVLLGTTSWHRKCQFSSAIMTFLEVLSKKMLYKNVWVFLLLLGFVFFLAKLVTTEYEIDSKNLHFIT